MILARRLVFSSIRSDHLAGTDSLARDSVVLAVLAALAALTMLGTSRWAFGLHCHVAEMLSQFKDLPSKPLKDGVVARLRLDGRGVSGANGGVAEGGVVEQRVVEGGVAEGGIAEKHIAEGGVGEGGGSGTSGVDGGVAESASRSQDLDGDHVV
mmetsp:Transcript_37153/g.88707  ORF Transcript_37153/g.88707 Transcript_37153/m.88707 type:complete len:154 (+) Transcript_37153:183-644(+)